MLGKRGIAGSIFIYVALVLSVIVMGFPIFWILIVSFKTEVETFQLPMTWGAG